MERRGHDNTGKKHMTAWGHESTGITESKTEDKTDLHRRQERHVNRRHGQTKN